MQSLFLNRGVSPINWNSPIQSFPCTRLSMLWVKACPPQCFSIYLIYLLRRKTMLPSRNQNRCNEKEQYDSTDGQNGQHLQFNCQHTIHRYYVTWRNLIILNLNTRTRNNNYYYCVRRGVRFSVIICAAHRDLRPYFNPFMFRAKICVIVICMGISRSKPWPTESRSYLVWRPEVQTTEPTSILSQKSALLGFHIGVMYVRLFPEWISVVFKQGVVIYALYWHPRPGSKFDRAYLGLDRLIPARKLSWSLDFH